jgi:hypothetical protein
MFTLKVTYKDDTKEIFKDYVSLKHIYGVIELKKENGCGTVIDKYNVKNIEFIGWKN